MRSIQEAITLVDCFFFKFFFSDDQLSRRTREEGDRVRGGARGWRGGGGDDLVI